VTEGTSAGGMKSGIRRILSEGGGPGPVLGRICDFLCSRMEACDWAGYYLVDPAAERELFLGPYSGAPTEHGRIGFGQGICGQAASSLRTFLVTDVNEEDNYLSCSPDVRSEIVVPVFHRGKLVGEIDLDSHQLGGFTEEDSDFLEWLAAETGELADLARNG